jgi:phenylalanyl-tRNA synthetase beta subunit
VAQSVRRSAAPFVEAIALVDVYRDRERLGTHKKSLLLTLTLRSTDGTLTGEQADTVCAAVVDACQAAHGAQLRA